MVELRRQAIITAILYRSEVFPHFLFYEIKKADSLPALFNFRFVLFIREICTNKYKFVVIIVITEERLEATDLPEQA